MKTMRSGLFLALLCSFSLALQAPSVQAQWVEDGTPLCTATGFQLDQTIVSDGAGGAIVTWEDFRGGDPAIYAQRVDASGVVLWTIDGVALCTATATMRYPTIASDGAGGAIVTWYDDRSGNDDIYAQRVDASGVVQWTADGVALCAATGDQESPTIVSDGAGGAVVTWHDYRSGPETDIYTQRVDASGAVQWAADGVALCTFVGDQDYPVIVSDGAGGAIVTWKDARGVNYDMYVQRVDASGAPQWTADGVALCTATGSQSSPTIVSDDAGGAIVTWVDYRGGNYDIYARRVDASGAVQWTADGVALCTYTGSQTDPSIVQDGAGGAIVTWEDHRSGNGDIYAQRVDGSGAVQWTADGEALCTATGNQYIPEVVSDGVGGGIVTWEDGRNADWDVYVQRVDAAGAIQWTADGVVLSTATDDQNIPKIVSDGAGGAIVAWKDRRNGLEDIYAQRVTRHGYAYSLAAPRVAIVEDIPGDEGGSLWLEFEASHLDTWPYREIDYYSIWRSIFSPYEPSAAANAIVLDAPGQATAEMVGNAFFATTGGYWQLVGTIEAYLLSGYGYAVTTLRDSTSVDPGWEYYCVAAHGSEDFDCWYSAPDSGYSVDNLSPEAPAALAAEYVGGSSLYLHWNPNTEVDLHHYAIYRGAVPDFVPDEISLIGTGTDTFYVDTGFGYSGEYYYKVSAIDIHENESAFALLTPDMITGVPGESPHYDNVLFQNSPNPFPSSTQIAFSIKEAGHVRLKVFDAKGRLVRVLVDEVRQASKYIESWDGRDGNGKQVPAGMYFCRLEAPGWKASKKMTLAR